MPRDARDLIALITDTVRRDVAEADTVTRYREPLIGYTDANAPGFWGALRSAVPGHMMPSELLQDARSIVAFFVPFDGSVVEANSRDRGIAAPEWALAYVETNRLISRITDNLINLLAARGVRAAAEPPTDNFDHVTLVSRWSHKSVAVIAGLGSFGLHQMVITDAGCAGRFGSVVTDAELPHATTGHRERCLYYYDGSCRTCLARCPVGALSENDEFDRQGCWKQCLEAGARFEHLGPAEVCGKCAIGPCALESPVQAIRQGADTTA